MFFNGKLKKFSSKYKEVNKFNSWLNLLTYSLFFIFCVLCLRYQYFLLNYREWGDESETIVAAKMMFSGMKLYSEIFNHHGPLTFLPGMLTELFGNFSIRGNRVSIAILQILAILSIYHSPLLTSRLQRVITSVISALIILVYLPDDFGHTYQYQPITGIFIVVILSQYVLPSIINTQNLSTRRIILGSILISSLPFLAITYLPVASLLFLSAFRFNQYKLILLSSALGLFFNLLFLGVYGSFAGFWAFHIYLNAEILPLYNGVEPGWKLILNALKTATYDLNHFLSIVLVLYGSILISQNEKRFPWRILLVVFGLFSLLMRGAWFQGVPFFYAILPFFLVITGRMNTNINSQKYIIFIFLLLCTLKVSLLFPGDKHKLTSLPIPTDSEFSNLVTEYTTKSDKIIAYSFQNLQYLLSDRLPASGNFFYLPWQDKYNENPKFDIKIDTCKQIMEYKPKIMLIDKWKVWDKFTWSSYTGCLQNYINKNYQQIPNKPYYIRKDLIIDADEYFSNIKWTITPSRPLNKNNSIKLKFNNTIKENDGSKKLIKIGIRFGTYMRENAGLARIDIKKKNNSNFYLTFPLSSLKDNSYKYFDIPSDIIQEGEIKSLTGEGVSTWESYNKDIGSFTCIISIYSDGSRSLTPGCPMI
ncbi:hypothetical protein MRO53_21865 [Escherichia coli]|nr:hypothetical protein [Escherichia coli]